MKKINKWIEFEVGYKNNLLILFHFFFPSTFAFYFLSLVFFFKLSGNQA